MSKIKIKFLEDGEWMDEPSKPIFNVKKGEEKEVSARLANLAIEGGKAEFVKPKIVKKAGPKKKAETGPTAKAEA